MSTIQSFRDLLAWQKAMIACRSIYRETASFPDDERFGLTNQLRRASISVPSNIAEGYGRSSRGEYLRFLRFARSSNYELETQCLIARGLGYLSQDQYQALEAQLVDTGRLLTRLIQSIERST